MSAASHAASLRLTPKHRFHPALTPAHTPVKSSREENGLQLTLKSVIGTTTSSNSAFHALPERHFFVCCAGPAVVLNRVDEQLNITQQSYRARPNASPINATPSFYNPSTPPNTPGRSRHGSPLKDGTYGIGSTATLEYTSDSPGHGKASNWSREATCVSLSHCGKFLAVGETGYNPRILLFSTTPNAPSDTPLSVLSDHSFGVSAVAFSRDSRWLCTLGNTYDAFILIYSINPKNGSARLHSSNKCSNVNFVTWLGQSVISIGTRHAKVWRVEKATPMSPSKTRLEMDNTATAPPGSPTPKTFSGRNCLLGILIDATFTAVVAISDQRAILCTAQGDICLLDDTQRTQRLERVAKVDFGILCVTLDNNVDRIYVAGQNGGMRSISLNDLLEGSKSPGSTNGSSLRRSASILSTVKKRGVVAIGVVRERIVTIDSNRIIELESAKESDEHGASSVSSKRLAAHESAVLGVCSLLPKLAEDDADFLTFSAKGTVLFWRLSGESTASIEIPLEQPKSVEDGDTNELKIVAHSRSDGFLISGDKSGVLRLIARSGDNTSALQAHSGDVNGIAITKVGSLTIIATCGRDRTLQLFQKDDTKFTLLQTLDDHAASVSDVLFLNGASSLLSISSDRTIIVRRLAFGEDRSLAFIPIRVITLKSSPLSFTCIPSEPNLVVVATVDRLISRYDISSGRLIHSFKASDPSTNDTVLMSSLGVHEMEEIVEQSPLLIGVSSTDKSIRVHDYYSGSMLLREHGQTTVSAIKLIQKLAEDQPPQRCLISCGLDGTVMIWEVSSNLARSGDPDDVQTDAEFPLKLNPTSTQPIRRILSRAKLSDLQKSLESEDDTVSPIRSRAPSPSRVRRKTSRYSLAAVPKLSAPSLTINKNDLIYPAIAKPEQKSSQDHSPTLSNASNTLRAKARHPSLDPRQRSKSTANLNDLNDSAEQLCKSLQTFRKRITLSATDKLEPETAQELKSELKLTIEAVKEQMNGRVGHEKFGNDLLDVYLAKMIDERLALKAKPEETKELDPKATTKEAEDEDSTSAGAQETTSE